MVNFELVIDMVNTICQGDITKGMNFNDFVLNFTQKQELYLYQNF